jgi:hypothetical protein
MNERTVIIILFLLFVVLSGLGFSALLGPYGDNGRYIVLAKSLVEGKGFRQINFPDESVGAKIPPLYPAILAILIFVFGYNIIILKISSLVFMGSALIFFYLYMRKINVPLFIRLSVFFLLCTNPYTLEYSREVLSEAPFVFFVALTALFLAGYKEQKQKGFLYAAIVFSSCACLLRDVGLVMLVTIAIILFKKKEHKRLLGVVAVCIVFAGAWLYRNLTSDPVYLKEFVSGGNYLTPSNQMIGAVEFIRRYAYESCAYLGDILPDYIIPAYKAIAPHSRLWLIKIISGFLFFSVIGYGFLLLRRRKKNEFFLLFPLLYGLCLPLFGSYGIRYVIPIGIFLFLGLSAGLSGIPLFNKKWAFVILFILVLGLNISTEAREIAYIRQGYPGEWANYYKALLYLKANTDKQKVLICIKPFLGYLVSEHRTLGYPRTVDTQALFDYIQNSGASYVIIDSLKIVNNFYSRKYLLPAVKKHAASFSLVYQLQKPLTEVYRIMR